MKIVIAPDSFKECLSAMEAAAAIEAGFREIFPQADYVTLPLADGGEGTAATLVAATGGWIVPVTVTGPLGERVAAFYGRCGDSRTAVVELAAASGLTLVPPPRRNPLLTTTFGTGELLRRALDAGVDRVILGIGGSATNDGGAGMLQALGVRLLDADEGEIGPGGGELARLSRIDASGLDSRLGTVTIQVACDVTNPLLGDDGASAVYAPQKGADRAMVARLEESLSRYAALLRRDLGADVAEVPGSGAAGGSGAALLAIGGRLRPGVEIVMEAVGLEAALRDADLVITGEGRLDGQTVRGKVVAGVAALAKQYNRPTIALAGGLGEGAEAILSCGVDAFFSVTPRPCSLEEALAQGAENLQRTARSVAATIRLSRGLL
jgi:glycerate kinase